MTRMRPIIRTTRTDRRSRICIGVCSCVLFGGKAGVLYHGVSPATTHLMKTLTLVVTYNEADNIARLVPDILKNVPDSSVLVVDDNSPDGTTNVVQNFARNDSRVHVLCRTTERGYGSATIAGMQYGLANDFDAILTLDADFSHD